jgi:Glycosyl hydrolase 2 galactose-binding domain-like/Exo-beta-D-glucosaminidase Ig-fold domain/Glycosyl hydrolases family 2/NedA-like, galactose-binding domain
METTISRRDFLIKATTVTAAAYSCRPAVAQDSKDLRSTLSPVTSGELFNVAANRLAYQSSSIDDNRTAHLVTDGSRLTMWESKPGGDQWIAIDLGDAFAIDHLTIRWGHAFASAYRIQVSSQPPSSRHTTQRKLWQNVYETSNGSGGTDEIPLISVSARHIRLVATIPSNQTLTISEIEAWSREHGPSRSSARQIVSTNGTALAEGWSLLSANFNASTPEEISSAHYDNPGWLPAVVPGTVLASYLTAGAIPDPFFGDQQSQVSEEFFTHNDFWYRNSFHISDECHGRRLWLVFEGINWKADVYLNGTKLGSIAGAFIRTRFDITHAAIVGGVNCVAVLIHQVDHPGPVQHKILGGHYRNGGILGLDSPTFLASIGWNWLPTIRGRNTGIWNHVRFETTGNVILEDPWVATESLAPDNSQAQLAVKTGIRNLADASTTCSLILTLHGVSYRQQITLQPHESRSIEINKSHWTSLDIPNPQLWWPNGYGDPALHTLQLQVECDGSLSHDKSVTFGIRKFDYRTDDGILAIYVNHCKILCRGGNWGMDQGMLMCDRDGYDLRVRMHRDMNLNMIRNWVGMVGRDEFYDACDRYGLLIWDDFWLANPVDGHDPSDHPMFMSNALDKIRRVRHHASLALYCGRNEGDPPPDIDAGLRTATASLDGTRFYIPASASGLVTGHGPYDNQDPAWYFEHRGTTFHSEQGIVCVPPVESMRAMMPESSLWPISDMWAIHDYQAPRSVLYTQRIAQRYGPPTGIDAYCRKAQMLNLETAKAIYESLQSHQGGGLLIWMTQAAWPALICQLYDYSFEQTGAYFGAKTACRPLHILWDQFSNAIKIANNTPHHQPNLQAEAWIYDINGRERWHKQADLSIPPTSAQQCFSLDLPPTLTPVFFVKLALRRGSELIAENFYWAPTQNEDCTALDRLPQVRLTAFAHLSGSANSELTATISNPTSAIALAIRLKIVDVATGERILPAMYQDNYFSLLPSETRRITITFPQHPPATASLELHLEGWNIEPRTVHIQ